MGKKLSDQTECEFELSFKTKNPDTSIELTCKCELGKLGDMLAQGWQELHRELDQRIAALKEANQSTKS